MVGYKRNVLKAYSRMETPATPEGKDPAWLLDHAANIHSQHGEDGVIEAIFRILPPGPNPWCVEFGAWDGIHLSNTRRLVESANFAAVLIEGDAKRFRELEKNCQPFPKTVLLNRMVGFGPRDNLDVLLAETPIPIDFELLSIDIDGNDYHVWKALQKYQPRVVVIEFNPTIPTPVRFVQEPKPERNHGASLLSLVELGQEKGYELVSVLPCNAVFVRKEYLSLFGLPSNRPEDLRKHEQNITWLFSGMDGRIFLTGARRLIWHGVRLRERDFQILPKRLRRYPGLYTPWQLRLLRWFKRWLERG